MISSPWSSMSEPVPLRSKRVVISFMAWAMAFFTSCRSTLLTTSKELSARTLRAVAMTHSRPSFGRDDETRAGGRS